MTEPPTAYMLLGFVTPCQDRNIVERCVNRLKQGRDFATRYDKAAESYLAAVTIASIIICLRAE